MARDLYRFSEAALDDLADIWQHIFSQSGTVRTADRVIDRIYESLSLLGENPLAGHLREELTTKPFRFWSVWSYLVAYEVEGTMIRIVRVFHGAQDVETLMAEMD